MKIIIISDIHGNLEALNATLAYIEKIEGDKKIVCLGDIVGYGPNPVECLKSVQSHTDKICMGNHEYAILNDNLDSEMVWYASDAIRWTKEILDDEMIKVIREFQVQIEENNILYVHASPNNPMGWKYISNTIDAYADLAEMDCTLCFVGHTHIPGVYADYELRRKDKMTILSGQGKTIINVGSIGQPRDGSPQLAFAVFDDADWNVEIVRLDYEYQETMRKIKITNLPSFLADRLMVGI